MKNKAQASRKSSKIEQNIRFYEEGKKNAKIHTHIHANRHERCDGNEDDGAMTMNEQTE